MPVQIHSTTCPMDCPDTCALEVETEDGHIGRIGAGAGHPVTGGFICTKVARFGQRVTHPDRLLYPMRRQGSKGTGKFVRISWEDAISEITERFRAIRDRWGAEAILPYHYGGSNGFLTDDFVDDAYFAKLGASRLAKTICAAPSTEVAVAMYGKMPGVAFEDYVLARCIIIWGANPKASNIHLVPFLRKAKRAGAFIAAVDPRKNFSSAEVDLHLAVFPGADLPLALAMIRTWKQAGQLDQEFLDEHADGLEPLLQQAEQWPVERAAAEARVRPEDIVALARKYAESAPAVVRSGWGLERNRNGGQALAAILAMPALLGKFGVRGGGYTMSNSGASKLDVTKVLGHFAWETRTINMTQLGQSLLEDLEPPIKGLFVYNCNPAVTVPDQNAVLRGLQRDDLFTVVFEQVMTDTAKYADIVLPATTFLEHEDIRRSYGSYVIGGLKAAIPAPGEARSNIEVFTALGRAMGWEDDAFRWDPGTYFRKAVQAIDFRGTAAEEALLAAGRNQKYDFPGPTPVQFGTVRPQTPDGKIHLTPPVLGNSPFRYEFRAAGHFPLAMISPGNSKLISSSMGEFNLAELWVTLHPSDASPRKIMDSDHVRVFNELGEVVCRARLSDRVREGVVEMPKGAWRKSSLNGMTSTALCPSHVNEVGGGACFNDARVEVEKV